ncbi:MAG: hypothetical protein OXH77_07060 [Anaerolineaceae bacterium]|nr:hypothetical protein [Anaerolineaceae bacterium]
MRRLHATGRRERFVASGVYHIGHGLREYWSIHEVGGRAQFIRVDRDGRDCGRRSLLQEALRNANGNLERVDQQLYDLNGHPVARLRCTRFQNMVELALESRVGPCRVELPDDGDCLLLMPGILLAGMALSKAAEMPQPVNVLLIAQAGDGFAWERLTLAACCGPPVSVGKGAGIQKARACKWSDSDRAFWLDSHDITLRIEDESCRIELSSYARRHD